MVLVELAKSPITDNLIGIITALFVDTIDRGLQLEKYNFLEILINITQKIII